MYQGSYDKKISFRCSSNTFNILYSAYLKHKAYSSSLTFSDFIRNLCLGTVLSKDEDENDMQYNNV